MQNKPHHFLLPGFRSPRKSQGEGAAGDCLFLLEQAVFKRKKRSVLIFKIQPFPSILSPLQASIQRFIFSLRHFSFWNYFTKSMTYFFPYIFCEVIVNFLNSQRFLPGTSAGEHRLTLLQLPLPEWGPRASGWMAMFALGGLDKGECLTPYAYLYVSGDNRVPGAWGRTECDPMGCMLGWAILPEVKGLVLHWGGVLEEAPSSLAISGHRIWASHSYFAAFRNTVGNLGLQLSYIHTSWRLYFKWSTLRKQQTENKDLWEWW